MIDDSYWLAAGMPPNAMPHEHQLEGVRFLSERYQAALCDVPGLGKTLQVLAAARLARPRGSRILVVCPASATGV